MKVKKKSAKEDVLKNYAAILNKLLDIYKLDTLPKKYHELKKLFPTLTRFSSINKAVYTEYLRNMATYCSHLGLIDESLKFFRYMLNNAEDIRSFRFAIDCMCFNMTAKENASAADFQAIYDAFRSSFNFEPFPRRFYEHDKIRVGFLSGDFWNHVVMKVALPLLNKLDRNSFAVYCYSNCKKHDGTNKMLRLKIGNGWRDIYDLTDEQAAELIRDDEIDILFDLSNHTPGNRLGVMAYRPASVQISGIGFLGSTGLKTVDYFVTDVHCLGDSAPYFTEDFIVLPHSHICPEPPIKDFEQAAAPPCLKKDYVTFGSFNQYRKITDSMLITWKKIMDAVPDSRLILDQKIYSKNDEKNFVSNRLKQFGFDLNRVELQYNLKPYPYDYDDIDIALDTFPYNGVTTTYEALYMGVPVVSLYGDRHATRCGLSLLKNVGLEELAVDSYEDYVKRAVMLANDWELLALLKKNLRTMLDKSPLMDSVSYVHEMEQAFIEVLNTERGTFVTTAP